MEADPLAQRMEPESLAQRMELESLAQSVDTEALAQRNNPFVCNVCGRTYGRIDHLARHFRTHSNERPFKCTPCGKAFARADLLKRHAAVHEGTDGGKRRRARAMHACGACAAAKLKCDQSKPCQRCRTRGLDCVSDGQTKPRSAVSVNSTSSPQAPAAITNSHVPCSVMSNSEALGQASSTHASALASFPPATDIDASTIEDVGLSDFLRDVFHTSATIISNDTTRNTISRSQGVFTPRNLMDFGQDVNMDMLDLPLDCMQGWDAWPSPDLVQKLPEVPGGPQTDISTPSLDGSIEMGSVAFRRSAWTWEPNHEQGGRTQHDLATCTEQDRLYPALAPCQVLVQPQLLLDNRSRDRIIGMLLTVCDKANYGKVVSSFPNTSILERLIHDFRARSNGSIDRWVHWPSFQAADCKAELLALMIAEGAVKSPAAEVQRFGYALQELCRLSLPLLFEKDDSNTRDLQVLQAFALSLEIGVWSGDKRAMEIAESQSLLLITMLRRNARFRKQRQHPPQPLQSDTPDILEHKWRAWAEAEAWKRLAYHLYVYSAEVSMAFGTAPLISYSEVTLHLPASEKLWSVPNAQEWADKHGNLRGVTQQLSFVQYIWSIETIGHARESIDLDLTLYLVLLSHWTLVWEFRQLDSAIKAQGQIEPSWSAKLLASSKCRELRALFEHFQMVIDEWSIEVSDEVCMISEVKRMNLHVAFEDLQLVAGRDGEEEARAAYPSLKQWFQSLDARMAMWHAGQVLRAARRRLKHDILRTCPVRPLADFQAVALYHAGLAFWVYGLLARTHLQESEAVASGSILTQDTGQQELFIVDTEVAPASVEFQRFVALNRSVPALSLGDARRPELDLAVPLHDSSRCMNIVVDVMTRTWIGNDPGISTSAVQMPALVRNLIQLLNDLVAAALAL